MSIAQAGLHPTLHPHVEEMPIIFVEPDIDGVKPYYTKGMALLRFKTPGFGDTPDGESVIFGGSSPHTGYPEPPLVGEAGEDGVVPPDKIQVLVETKFEWLVPDPHES